jgi:2-keto-4-pentenoate hydratase/2-oxohepta-3-ene-1,7-dioic acid hydratase in catechol pathway
LKKEETLKVFSLQTETKEPFIGLEYEGRLFNFTFCWEIFKSLKSNGQGPVLHFLQLLIELDFFHADNLEEVITTIKTVRPVSDLEVKPDYSYLIPIDRPTKVLCLGRNYAAHAAESGLSVPKVPIIFAKAPSSLLPHQGTILMPSGAGRIDHEAELAVIIGKTGKDIPLNAAWDYVAGYSIFNDVTARDMQIADMKQSDPWFLSKSFDTFGPIGPGIVPRDEIADPQHLEITLKVNGEIRQQSNTAKMIFPIPEIIAYISRYITLNAGDIISTGTPEGISPLADGDMVEVEIEKIGLLRNFAVTVPDSE